MYLPRRLLPFFFCSCLSLLACGGSEDDADAEDAKTLHCDFREDGEARCQERRRDFEMPAGVPQGMDFQSLCTQSGGRPGKGACSKKERVGACVLNEGGDYQERVVDWYYAPTTEQEVRAVCDDTSFLSP